MQVIVVDKWSINPLPPSTEEEHIQNEQEEDPQQMATDEVSKEGWMVKYPQKISHDIEVQTEGSTEIETIEGEPS